MIKVGITHGDYNGIGYEVILKVLSEPAIFDLFTPVIYGSPQVLSYYRKMLDINTTTPINIIKKGSEAQDGLINIVATSEEGVEVKVSPGEPSRYAGTLAARALMDARADLVDGAIDAVVTAPINKDTIQSSDFSHHGHTEFFSEPFPDHRHMMLFVSSDLRVAVVTSHCPLKDVSSKLTKELVYQNIIDLEQTLKRDFGVIKPRIAVLGLNPHSGENGLLGTEEINVITPALEAAWQEDKFVFGPISPDGFWGSHMYENFDAVLAMYHDQGLIPFKLMAMEVGVNVTCGLPVVRTSPDHGTAYDIAGEGRANEESMRNAIYQAIDIIRHRGRYDEARQNPLKKRFVERGHDNIKLDLTGDSDEH